MGKRIAILGSTGSIGTSTIDVVRSLGRGYKVVGLGAKQRWRELAAQAKLMKPSAVVIADPNNAANIRALLNRGAIAGEKFAGVWMVDPASVERYRSRMERLGSRKHGTWANGRAGKSVLPVVSNG